jgi:hypothetical protein
MIDPHAHAVRIGLVDWAVHFGVWHLVSVFLSLFADSYLPLVGRSDDAAVRLFGKREPPQAYAIRDFLQRSDVPFEWVELRDNEQARAN